MRLAAIDVGSNSVHMVVADVSRAGHLEVIDRVKEMVRLGRRTFATGRLTADAMDLAVGALKNFERLARVRKVERLRAVATSAVREANNRATFLKRVKRETGLALEVISGPREASLIFEAARYALGLDRGAHLLVDVGGGSVELVCVRDGEPVLLRSLPLGALRLTERFLANDPPTKESIERLTHHLEAELGDVLQDIRHFGISRAVGTSGTINTLIAMARASRGEELGRLHGASASVEEVARLKRRVMECDAVERADLPGVDAKKIELLPAAAILVDFILSRSKAPELVACSWALREGILLQLAGLAHRRTATDVRRRSVEALAARFAGANGHGRQVARLGLKLLEATANSLGLPPESRELLEYAALLHDIGHAVDHDRHNRHSYYLIKNGDLFGFDPIEIEVIAQVARAHRKQAAKLDSPELEALPQSRRRLVRGLAAILRVADALDRSHFSVIKNISVSHAPGRMLVTVESRVDNADLELWTSERRTDLLAKLLDRRVILQQEPSSAGQRFGVRATAVR